jgi:hypothetical protein
MLSPPIIRAYQYRHNSAQLAGVIQAVASESGRTTGALWRAICPVL